ncbi:hypothetical protein [Microvirga arvi]|uniref:hypothetical protein n=1 Tax=Microvirga arvi TaxID=2778731 RepID=UPI00195082A9|nr:hypothetical protein [Microvirga arvi]
MPALDKKVIYLDQFAFSELFKIKAGTRRADAHDAFWRELYDKVQRVLLLQQVIFPTSDVHSSETIVSPFSSDLRNACEAIGGTASLIDTDEVSRRQVRECFEAYRQNRAPSFSLDVDDVMSTQRNAWLPDMRVFVNADYSRFAEGLRDSINRDAERMAAPIEFWREERPPFEKILQAELGSFGSGRLDVLRHLLDLKDQVEQSNDPLAILGVAGHPVFREFMELLRVFEADGLDQAAATVEVARFWHWPGNREQPRHRITAYLFAAIARKIVAGQRKPPTRGFMNDVSAIASYAPYVDAMFLDKECAGLLRETPLREDLKLRARIFSLNTRQEFLDYLDELGDAASDEVRRYSKRLYGTS